MSLLGLLGRGFGSGGSAVTVATPVLSIVDNADNTGATATISGATAGTSNKVYTSPWSTGFLTGTWTLSGTRTSDGNVSLAVPKGLYFAYVKSELSGAAAVSEMQKFAATDGDDPLFYRILYAVRDVVLGLNLTGIVAANTKVLKRGVRVQDFIGPLGATICPLAEQLVPHDNAREEYTPGVQVVLYRKSNQEVNDDRPGAEPQLSIALDWRYRLMLALTETALPGVPEVARVSAMPGAIFLPEAFSSQYDCCAMAFRCQTFVPHTVYP